MAKTIATPHHERHRNEHIGWLRAAVLGANDGLISTSSLLVGVGAAAASNHALMMTGVAALVAGALSMAAGEYVSVSSQADAEHADIRIERAALDQHPEAELRELTQIYVHRGLEPALARQVAEQLTAHDDLAAHLRDEVGIHDLQRARPVQAALASAAAFCAGAALPLAAILLAPPSHTSAVVMSSTVAGLLLSGALAAWAGGAPILRGALRVAFWGVLAMAAAHGIGSLFDVAV